jgi:hypothetical protein
MLVVTPAAPILLDLLGCGKWGLAIASPFRAMPGHFDRLASGSMNY